MTLQEAYEEYQREVSLYEMYGSTNTIGFYEWLAIKRYVIDED